MAGKQLETLTRSPGGQLVDTVDEPSAEWGWSGQFPRVTRALGWFMVLAMLVAQLGNHDGRVANLWMTAFAILLAIVLVRDIRSRRSSWRG